MTLTQKFEDYYSLIPGENLRSFTYRIRHTADSLTSARIAHAGISQVDIKTELELKLIKYEPRLGLTHRESGYSLTAAGVKKVYTTLLTGRKFRKDY